MAETNENAAALPSGPVAKVLRGIVNVICKINKFSGELMSYTLLLLLGLMIFEVLSRYVFKSPTVWGYDVSLWLFGMPALLAGGWCQLEKGHVNMDMLYNKFTPRWKAVVDCITSITFFAFVGVMMVQCFKSVNMAIVRSERAIGAWQVIVWPIKIWMPISCLLLLLQGVADFICNLYMAITGKELK